MGSDTAQEGGRRGGRAIPPGAGVGAPPGGRVARPRAIAARLRRAAPRGLVCWIAASLLLVCGCVSDEIHDHDRPGDDDSGDDPADGELTARIEAFPTSGYAPLVVAFDGSGSSAADGSPVSHSWDLDGDGVEDATAPTATHEYAGDGSHLATLTVGDGQGDTAAAAVTIDVAADQPVLLLDEPFDSDPFAGGRWSVFLQDCAEPRDGTVEYRTEDDGCGGAGGYITRGSTYRCVVYSGPAFSTAGYHQVTLDLWARHDDGVVRVDALIDGAWQTVSDVDTAAPWTARSIPLHGDTSGLRVLLRDGAVDCITVTGVPICRPDEAHACPGGAATFSVSAFAGDGYRWQRDGVDLEDGGHILGADEPLLVIHDAGPGDEGPYRCRIATAAGDVWSNPGTLVVATAPTIVSHPSSVEVTAGDAVALAVDAVGVAPLHYRWQKDGADLSDGPGIAGSTTAVLTLAAAQAADAGDYRAVVSDACGDEAASADARLVVRSWDGEAPLVAGGAVHVDLDYDSDWILEAELLGCHATGTFDRYLRQVNRLDLFHRGSDQLALRLANTQTWFASADVGSVSTPIGNTDHFGETLAANVVQGDHTLRVEYLGGASRARLYWDGALIGDWILWIESVPGPMGDVEVSHVTGGTVRWYHGAFTSLAEL